MDTQFPKRILYLLKSVDMFPCVSVGAGSYPNSLPLCEAADTRASNTIWQKDFLELKLVLDSDWGSQLIKSIKH